MSENVRIALAWVFAALVVAHFYACGAGTPSPAQQTEFAAYEARLQACIAEAKALDASPAVKMASYKQCADEADRRDAQ